MKKTELIKKLSKLGVSNVVFSNGWISLVYDKHFIKSKVVKKHTKYIGNWSRKSNEVYYEPHLKKEDVVPILVHEAVEKYIAEKYRLDVDTEAHNIAELVEKDFISEKSWRSHQQKILHKNIHKDKSKK
jgi:hypothetical protein